MGEHIPQAVRSLLDEYFWNVTSFVDIAEELGLVGQVHLRRTTGNSATEANWPLYDYLRTLFS
ncbi:hypothetical protein ACTRXD_20400 [Nitrospira sp. T9]|uniref:hypothetical protein n=1 Tax=unclassified Nitrospira TaxID=2652172 RepID=UPI003F9DE4CA